jgi:DNA polymerase-3 subunit beta
MIIYIQSGNASYQIVGISSMEFPEMPKFEAQDEIRINAGVLKIMIRQTIFAVSDNINKPIYTGSLFEIKDKVMRIISIDGYRMAIRREKINIDNEFEFIVTSKAINEAVKLIEDENEPVKIKVGERLVSFNINGYDFISRLLEGEFVNYKKTIPATFTQKVTLNTRDLVNTIERVSLLISESFTTPVRCYFNELNVIFTCATSQGRATETFNIELEGESFEIGLNSRYLLDALKACETENIKILFNGPNTGVVIEPCDSEEFKYMIMPMRLK